MAGLCAVALLGCYRGEADSSGLSGGDHDGGDEIPAELEPAPATLRLLLTRQYVGAVRDLLGPEAAAVAAPPADVAINGFDAVGASQLALGDTAIDAYEESARAVAGAAAQAGTLNQWLACDPASSGELPCLRQVAESLGRRAWRRPLREDEIERYAAVGAAAAADLGFDEGLREMTAALLQSPYFIYQVELGEPDPGDPTRRRLTPYELAARMSFFLVDSVPDAELLDDAESGMLASSEGIREAAWRLLEQPQARVSVGDFFGEVWRLRNLPGLPKDQAAFPQWTPQLAASMRLESLSLIEDIVWERDADFREVFTADHAFVDARLAFHYGLPNAAQLGDTHTRVELEGIDKRGGLFGQAGFQALLSHISSTSPTLRGKFVLENILCRSVPPPPPGVVTDLPPTDGAQTVRERLEIHMDVPTCRGCHQLMDPIGFGLENYDGIGRFRTEENGATIDPNAELDGMPFDGAASLGAIVGQSPGTTNCLVRNLYRHATGHIEGDGEQVVIDQLEDVFIESGHRLPDLLVEIVANPAFAVVAEPE